MSDTTQTAEAAQASTAETTAPVSQTAEQTGQAETGAQAQTTEVKATETAAQPQGEQKPAENPAVKQESKPIPRRSAQYRLNQVLKENQELKAKVQTKEQNGEEGQPAEQNPDVSTLVQKEVQRILNPFMSESSKTADDAELNELFTGDKASERTKYEGKIREMWNEPQYKDVAAADLYKIASFDDAVAAATAKAIEEYKKADQEARGNSASGHSNTSNRTGSTARSVDSLSAEELEQHNNLIKAGKPGLI